ncbi:hypothetical protein BGX38DRAFT_605885 [Terfezia claveryi]|nr:hypothetical protein BGX38DRAFT_707954 [Terfezia claveryi]KAF8447136.1 hypothetical protein BGX38DRAFT_605885 [Terfezia claveryi]
MTNLVWIDEPRHDFSSTSSKYLLKYIYCRAEARPRVLTSKYGCAESRFKMRPRLQRPLVAGSGGREVYVSMSST